MARYFVTGAQGCIGAWVVKNLVDRAQEVFVFDLDLEPKRLGLLLNAQALSRVQFIRGDVCDSGNRSPGKKKHAMDWGRKILTSVGSLIHIRLKFLRKLASE